MQLVNMQSGHDTFMKMFYLSHQKNRRHFDTSQNSSLGDKGQSETYWAYIPDPPILHLLSKKKKIVVTVNDACPFDWPATQEFPVAQKFSYAGYGKKKIPLHFTKEKKCYFKGISQSVSKTNKQCTYYAKLLLLQGNW